MESGKTSISDTKHAKERLVWAKAHRHWTVTIENASFGLMKSQCRKRAMLREFGFFDVKIRGKSMPIYLLSKISGSTSNTSSVSNFLIQQGLKDRLKPSKQHCVSDCIRSGGKSEKKY